MSEQNEEIYLVMGTTGEYSDTSVWVVAAYKSRAKAQEHVARAESYAKAEQARRDDDPMHLHVYTSPFDPHFQMSYTGTSYMTVGVPLRDAPPIEVAQ